MLSSKRNMPVLDGEVIVFAAEISVRVCSSPLLQTAGLEDHIGVGDSHSRIMTIFVVAGSKLPAKSRNFWWRWPRRCPKT